MSAVLSPPAALAVSAGLTAVLIVAAALVGAGITYGLLKLTGSGILANAKRDANDVLDTARREAETTAKQIELDARNELAKRREAAEQELTEERASLKDQERRLDKREDNLDRKLDTLATKEKYLDDRDAKLKQREAAVEQRDEELDGLIKDQIKLLETTAEEQKRVLLRIGNLSEEDARKEAIAAVERQMEHEAGQIIQRSREKAEEEAKDEALKITLQAIQRYAGDHTADHTTNAIHLPSDDMKGRVIGREGRNIRAFEQTTGVDVIVDETPGVVVVSCFDPVRRAIASETLKKLLDDGRIHPSRIEEVHGQVSEDIGQRIIKFGKEAAIEANVQGLHPKVAEAMGKLHYRTSYGQNILKHSIETAYLCQVIADELGLDGELARRCGYLHDIGKAMDHDQEGGHPKIGAEFARRFGETSAVLNAIEGHHNDIPSTTPYTPIVMAADAISGARPGARRETMEKYIKRLRELEDIAGSMSGVKEAYAIQAGREVRVIVDPDKIDDAKSSYIAREIAKKVSEQMTFPGEIRVTVMRQLRTIEFAR